MKIFNTVITYLINLQQSRSKKYTAIIKLNHGMFYPQTVIKGFVFI